MLNNERIKVMSHSMHAVTCFDIRVSGSPAVRFILELKLFISQYK